MPWRPRSLWRSYKSLANRDPSALVFAFGVYALLYGLALVLPGNAFDAAAFYGLARELGIPEALTGWGMLLNAVLLFVCLAWPMGPMFRSFVSIGTGAAWFFWGGLLLGGGWQVGYFSPGGAWSMITALLVMQATAGWVYPAPIKPLLVDDERWN